MDIITRKEAKSQGLLQYFTGNPCPKGHIDLRNVSSGQCCQCARDNSSQYRANHLISVTHKHRLWREHNRSTISKNSSAWAKNNRARKCEIANRYYVAKIKAIPPWFDRQKTLQFYEQAEVLTSQTGIIHHVDHIIPLQGETVCGLHVHTNLQVLTGSANCAKGNQLLIDSL